LDDGVEVTDEARRAAPGVCRRLKAPQLAAFIAEAAEEIADPLDVLLAALEEVRGLEPGRWKERRDEVAGQVARLGAGVDRKADRLEGAVSALLARARSLTDAQFKARRGALERAARQLAGRVEPAEVLRHTAEHALAELLSNPRLGAAL